MSRHVLSTQQTGDTQLSLFGPGEVPPASTAKSTTPANPAHMDRWAKFQGQPRASMTTSSTSTQYDPHQLALMINPTEHISRMERSTDTNSMGIYTGVGTNTVAGSMYDADIHEAGSNPAPNREMNLLWKVKEAEARQPSGSYAHGSGMYDIINSGEQIREPIQVRLGDVPERDEQYEGHHRVAAGHAVQQDRGPGYGPGSVWLPVRYDSYDYHYAHRDAERQERAANAKLKANR